MENITTAKTLGSLAIGDCFGFPEEPGQVYCVLESHPGRVLAEALTTGLFINPTQLFRADELVAPVEG